MIHHVQGSLPWTPQSGISQIILNSKITISTEMVTVLYNRILMMEKVF